MSSGSQIATYLVPEDTVGTRPDPATFDTLRLTGNSMTPNVSVDQSSEIRADRMNSGGIITSQDFGGELAFEMSAGSFDKLLEAALWGTWATDVLEIGSDRHTFTAVKHYKDAGLWHTFTGVHIGTFSLEIPEEGKVTGTFGTMALDYEDASADPLSLDTINAATTTVPMGSATSVGDILVDDASLAGQACISAMSLNIDNSMQTQRCLGKAGPGALIATRANVTGSVTLAWAVESYNLWKKQMTREGVKFTFPLSDAAGNTYTIEVPEAELDGDLPDGGNEDIVQVQLDFTAKNSPLKITRSLV
tara:strand:- start:41869 stop:42783 length:915 start_codon:yes stop_codon:yes gene_type:complete